MFKLKPISKDALASAIERAERYRLLNEPVEAESICLDVLDADPTNRQALVTLILSLTDQFDERADSACTEAVALVKRLDDPYSQAYFEGVVCERRAKAHLKQGGFNSGHMAYDWYRQAMDCFEKAELIRPEDNDEAILRWNTCARTLMRNPHVTPRSREATDTDTLE